MTDFSAIADSPRSDNPELLRALAADLRAMDFTVDGVAELLGADASSALARDQVVPASIKLRVDHSPLATAIKLWVLAEVVPAQDVEKALPSVTLEDLALLGLAEASTGLAEASTEASAEASPRSKTVSARSKTVSAVVDLRPYGWPANEDGSGGADLWVASDLGAHQRSGVLRHDHVLGIGQASLTLAQSTIRHEVERALDLGTGCGIQLFHLLSHAKSVVATDISERALAVTRFNLMLNALELGLAETDLDPANKDAKVSLRLGSLLEPVQGEQFDLIVSNPPFVITPRNKNEHAEDQFTYRDGGLAGDAIVEQLVRGLPSVMAPGGIAQMLGNWEITHAAPEDAAPKDANKEPHAGAEVDWSARPKQWIQPGTQAWFIQREQVSPGGYAETWLQDASQGRDPKRYAAAYEDYINDFASRNVAGIGFGCIVLRNSPVESRFEEILYPIEQPIGPALAATLQRQDSLETRQTIVNEFLETAEDVTEERHQKPGAEHPGVILLRQGAGLRRTNLLSTELAGFVSASDGELSVGQIIGALASILERDDHEFAENLHHEVRNLVRDGFLLPAQSSNRN